jgi:Domain of unknown function (DUF4252)
MQRSLIRLVALSLLAAATSACGITGNFRHDPGYAAFDSPGIRDTDREFALSLGPVPLSLARLFVHDDPDLAPLLRDLRAVRVYIYELDGQASRVNERLLSSWTDLAGSGWESVVAVRDDGESVSVLVKTDRHDRIRGLAVMTQDESDVVMINLIGKLRPAMFNAYMAELDIEAPPIEIYADRRQPPSALPLSP